MNGLRSKVLLKSRTIHNFNHRKKNIQKIVWKEHRSRQQNWWFCVSKTTTQTKWIQGSNLTPGCFRSRKISINALEEKLNVSFCFQFFSENVSQFFSDKTIFAFKKHFLRNISFQYAFREKFGTFSHWEIRSFSKKLNFGEKNNFLAIIILDEYRDKYMENKKGHPVQKSMSRQLNFDVVPLKPEDS